MKPLHLIAAFMAILIISLPVCFADELRLQYDANGNVVYDGQYYREYNGLNQLYRIWNGSNTSSPIYQEYTYHPLEERVLEKRVYLMNGSLKERVIYFDRDYVRIINSSGTFDYEYIHAEGQLMAQINPDGSIYYMETDIKGDVVAVMNSTGAVIENTSYSPYGEVLTGGKATRFGYEAQEHDSVLGDTDFHARKYKADWGIFLQPDSLLPNVYDPQQLNRYMFERGNPYLTIDPTGHDSYYGFQNPQGKYEYHLTSPAQIVCQEANLIPTQPGVSVSPLSGGASIAAEFADKGLQIEYGRSVTNEVSNKKYYDEYSSYNPHVSKGNMNRVLVMGPYNNAILIYNQKIPTVVLRSWFINNRAGNIGQDIVFIKEKPLISLKNRGYIINTKGNIHRYTIDSNEGEVIGGTIYAEGGIMSIPMSEGFVKKLYEAVSSGK